MQAIVTKYIGPTNFRGARVKARTETHTVTIPWDDALDVEQNHAAAAAALAFKFQWLGTWLGGGLPDTSGNAYVRVSSDPEFHKNGCLCAFSVQVGGTVLSKGGL